MESETTPEGETTPRASTPQRRTSSFVEPLIPAPLNNVNISLDMLERKLVTLRKVTEIRRPCSLRFRCLVVAKVSPGGQEVVTHKGEWNIGDYVLFFEPDSFIPARVLKIGWLKRHNLTTFDGEKGYYVKARMVGNQLSRGYIMAISDHPIVQRIVNLMEEEYGVEEGRRVASMMAFEEVMGVKKWEPRA